MITNATLLRIDRRTGVSPAGTPLYTTGDAITPPFACGLFGVTNTQRWQLGAAIQDVAYVLYLDKADTASTSPPLVAPQPGDRVSVALDGEDAVYAEVVIANNNTHDLVSHHELFLKKV